MTCCAICGAEIRKSWLDRYKNRITLFLCGGKFTVNESDTYALMEHSR